MTAKVTVPRKGSLRKGRSSAYIHRNTSCRCLCWSRIDIRNGTTANCTSHLAPLSKLFLELHTLQQGATYIPQHTSPHHLFFHRSLRLAQLLFPEKCEETNTDNKLHAQSHPEPCFGQTIANSATEIRKDVTRSDIIWCYSSGKHSCNRTQNLSSNKSESDMNSCERLEKNHTETDTLQRVQHTKPEPETSTDECGRNWSTSPRNILSNI